jgi:hypothetical protein
MSALYTEVLRYATIADAECPPRLAEPVLAEG